MCAEPITDASAAVCFDFTAAESTPMILSVAPNFLFPLPGRMSPNLSADGTKVEILPDIELSSLEEPTREDDMTAEEFEKTMSSLRGEVVEPVGQQCVFGQVRVCVLFFDTMPYCLVSFLLLQLVPIVNLIIV